MDAKPLNLEARVQRIEEILARCYSIEASRRWEVSLWVIRYWRERALRAEAALKERK